MSPSVDDDPSTTFGEETSLILEETYDQVRSLEVAQKQSLHFNLQLIINKVSIVRSPNKTLNEESVQPTLKAKCFFCGYRKHPVTSVT